jgi:hypothetical protein
MAKTAGVNGVAVAATGTGLLFAWSGIKGGRVTDNLRSLLSGQQPKSGNANPVTTPTAAPGTPLTGTGTGPQPGVSSVGGAYSNGALQSLWIMAGGSPAKAGVAACIAQHESGGNAGATSSNPDGGTNVGLWQLDTPGGKGAGFTVAQLQNALTNARVAVKGSSNGTDWSAWSTAPMCGV